MLEREIPDKVETLGDILRTAVPRFSSYSAVNYGKNVWSYKEIDEMSQSLCTAINNEFPVKKGQRVLVILPPSIQNVLAYFSLWSLGLCPIPVDSKIPLELLNRIVSSGKISGLVTYSNLFSQIDKEDTAGLYTLLTDSTEFRSPFSGKNPDMEGNRRRGSLQRPRMEEMCYGESGYTVSIDNITDVALSNIGWNKDGNFTFIDFNHATILNALKTASDTFPMRESIPHLVTKEPMNSWEVVVSLLLPLYKGARLIMCEGYEDDVKKNIERNCRDESCSIWTSNKTFKVLEKLENNVRDRLSIIYKNTISPEGEFKFLGKHITSLFCLAGHELSALPIFFKQYLKEANFKLLDSVKVSPETSHPIISKKISGEGYENEDGNVELKDITSHEDSFEFSRDGPRGDNYFTGFGIPTILLEKWLNEKFKIKHNDLSIEGDPLTIRIKNNSNIPQQSLPEMISQMLVIKN